MLPSKTFACIHNALTSESLDLENTFQSMSDQPQMLSCNCNLDLKYWINHIIYKPNNFTVLNCPPLPAMQSTVSHHGHGSTSRPLLMPFMRCRDNELMFTVKGWASDRTVPMHSGLSHERNVCPSVKCMNCDQMKETSTEILILWLVVDNHWTWNFRPNCPCSSEIADFKLIFARSASAITPS